MKIKFTAVLTVLALLALTGVAHAAVSNAAVDFASDYYFNGGWHWITGAGGTNFAMGYKQNSPTVGYNYNYFSLDYTPTGADANTVHLGKNNRTTAIDGLYGKVYLDSGVLLVENLAASQGTPPADYGWWYGDLWIGYRQNVAGPNKRLQFNATFKGLNFVDGTQSIIQVGKSSPFTNPASWDVTATVDGFAGGGSHAAFGSSPVAQFSVVYDMSVFDDMVWFKISPNNPNGALPQYTGVDISVIEAPVPEPSSLVGLGALLIGGIPKLRLIRRRSA